MPVFLHDFASRSLAGWLVLLALLTLGSARPAAAADEVDYLQEVKPILSEKCYSCHGALKQEAGLRLETRALMVDDSGVVTPGDADGSWLLDRVTAEGAERMPPPDEGSALLPDETEVIRRWIDQGAIAPEEAIPPDPREHWAFHSIDKPKLPSEIGDGPIANPIDAFLDAKRQKLGLKTQPLAPRPLLIRRLYLDLIGLPPTVEQLRDDRPWETIIDELLSSQHHGERWARHWMDVWRYSDWYGLGAQLRYSQKHLWHWRDWIVDSLNQDKGYDLMITEMLAGDELAPEDPDVVRATGFLARNYYLFNRTTWLDSTIEHTGKAFLGLTLNCAKCHDHKYDPISQLDYYRFRAIFEPHQVRLDPVPGETDFEQDGLPRVFDDQLEAETFLHQRGDPNNPDTENKIEPGVPAILASFAPEIEPIDLPVTAYAPALLDYVQEDRLTKARQAIGAARGELETAKKQRTEDQAKEQSASASPSTASTESFSVEDSFDEPRPELWQLNGDGWEYRDGALHQTKASRENQRVVLRATPPRDFELTARYTTTGGTTYKSVTFRFDHSLDNQYDNFVYTSAYEQGSKLQAAQTREGKAAYPAAGRVARSIEVGQAYTLRLAVRDTLLNVWLDDELLIAHRLPNRGAERRISFSGFDATVAFDSIAIRSLPESVELKPAAAEGEQPRDGEQAVRRAETELAVAEAEYESLRARLAADRAKYLEQADADTIETLVSRAARAEATVLLRKAERDLLVAGDDATKKQAAEKAIAGAKEKLKAVEQGNVSYQSVKAAKKALESPAHDESDYAAVYPSTSTGRRLALARWTTARQNPLTARVAVNHVWMRHFGEPLVESVFDFGRRAERPLHADLLDYLAAEFVDSGWSFKYLHRLMVSSQAYRLQTSNAGADADTLESDPTNRYYWRMNSRRMEAQVARDSLLHLADELDLRLGGPSVEPGPKSRRRSLYFLHSRDSHDQFLTMFDDADLLQCYRRSESIVPQQALALSNSKLALDMSRRIAEQIHQQREPAEHQERFIRSAFFAILGRQPNKREVEACRQFAAELSAAFEEQGVDPGQRDPRIRARMTAALLNHNDFITIR